MGWAYGEIDGKEVGYGVEEATVYEMVRMDVEVVERRTYPQCAEPGCDTPAEHWGLCPPHAREGDPETYAEIIAARNTEDPS